MKNFVMRLLFLLTIFFVSCTDDKIIDEEKFVDIYSEVLLAQSASSSDPETTSKILEKVCKDFNVTLEQYNYTIDFYKLNVELWEIFFEKVVKKLEEKKLKTTSSS